MAEFVDFESRAEGAVLAAAVGDALGWPQENRGGRVGGRRGIEPQLDFVEWKRRNGGRFASHEEIIGAGQYSDDTQLISAAGRCLLEGGGWWERWTRLELPFWLLYERGGGGATKRAAQAWTKGNPPWTGGVRNRYFSAGGNGVAMRVLPHCLVGREDFASIAKSIASDGIATHGHPRALVGALAYAYALWAAFRRRDRLPYGGLIEEMRDGVNSWAQLPTIDEVAPDWHEAANREGAGSYDELWTKAVHEMMDLLGLCARGIGHGALAVDREILEQLGTFDKRIGSAGTITAAGAVFLASRYASRAGQGLLAAAFARGADTDTLASMTGSLLAAINGGDWLGRTREQVQDDRYLVRLARKLIARARQEGQTPVPSDLQGFVRRLRESEIATTLTLPDGRIGHLRNIVNHATKTQNEIKTFVVETEDGQTLYIKRARKLRAEQAQPAPAQTRREGGGIAVALVAADLQRSIEFWREIAQQRVTINRDFVDVGGYLTLVSATELESPRNVQLDFSSDREVPRPRCWILVFVSGNELTKIGQRLKASSLPSISIRGGGSEWRGIRCSDPDGNVVEFRESQRSL